MDRKEPQVLIEAIRRHRGFAELSNLVMNPGSGSLALGEIDHVHLALAVAALRKTGGLSRKDPLCIVLPTDREAEDFASDLAFFGQPSGILPWWRVLAYRPVAPRAKVFGERSAFLGALLQGELPVVVASFRAFVTPVPPRSVLSRWLLRVEVGSSLEPGQISERLAHFGYLRVPRVTLPGEYAVRGEVIDLFIPGSAQAHRIQYDYDTVERISLFDPDTQAGRAPVKSCTVRPLKEVVWVPELLGKLREKGAALPGCGPRTEALAEELERAGEAKGEEYWYSTIFGDETALAGYFPPGTMLICAGEERLQAQIESTRKEYAGMYRAALRDGPVPPPEACLSPFEALRGAFSRRMTTYALKDRAASERLQMGGEPGRSYFGNLKYFREDLGNFAKLQTKTFIIASTEVQADRIETLLPDPAIATTTALIVGEISNGFSIPAIGIRIVQENEIFGRRARIPKSVSTSKSSVIESFIELSPGDYVVHVQYGIGRFASIERMRVLGNERDYIKIEYAETETVFVPIEQANLVQRYIGSDGEAPRLDSLGSKSWENRKKRVRKSVEELAERLIRIYARRQAAKGFAFPADGEWQTEFEASFPYEETPDQLSCIADIKRDMQLPRPMDRLVCGDVGYGKTEVALRACFKAMTSGKQVAFLAPTTILVEQHFENFSDRLEGYPLRIAMLSRLVERSRQKKILADLASGAIDMVVGTHRLLQKDIVFKDLGLLVIDEEQRFGVKHKERLKEIKASIDCLTLTATPIPRTLHMSMLKIRDMSILQTPPASRQPIQTYVEEYNPETVARAIRAEIERGGQVFYLHNRIESLTEIEGFIRSIVPEVLTESAHGQMDPGELEDIMHRFIHGAFHVLVSTTIIENGIDIPNVNTIIIDRADMYGVSQLYQLKGRVGRSDRQAYAYLLYPDKRALSEIAMKRLQIISDFTELGSGFKIAMKDLEVRGAGNLLGREQSGDIFAVGFEMYLKLLDEAVASLSGEAREEEPYLELEYSGYIPDDYVAMPMLKMEIYKKIASTYTGADLDALQLELEERFGPLPEELLSLLSLAEIRILCRKLSVSTLKERRGLVSIEFSKVSKVSVERLVRAIRESNGRIKLDPDRPNAILLQTKAIGLREKSEYIRERLASLV